MFTRKTTIGFVIFMVVLYVAASAQAPDTLWTRNFGGSGQDEAWQLKQTPDGGFVIIGFKESGNPADSDIYLIKTDEHGDTLWTRSFDYSLDDVGRSVEPLDTGYIISGYSGGSIVLLKTDSLGNEIWHLFLGSGSGRSIRVLNNGDFIIAGYKTVPGNTYDMYIAKTNSAGDILWSKTYGGTFAERAWDVRETADGGFVLVGWTTLSNGYADIYLVKTDANGDSIWSKTYGGTGNNEGRSILVMDDGGFIIAGKITLNYPRSNATVINADSNGNIIWSRTFSDSVIAIANSVIPTADGGYILTGMRYDSNYMSSSFVIKIDANGDSLWSTIIQDPEQNLYCRSIVQTDDGGYVVAGYHQVPNNANDVFLCKLAPEITGVEEYITSLPENISLRQNYPNPFNASTTILFSLAEPEYTTLSVYDLLGRKVQILIDGYLAAGDHNVVWNAEDYNSGIYFYNLKAGEINESKSMILLK